MIIVGKSIGRRKPLFADWSVPILPECQEGDGGGLTLAQLIERLVRAEVLAFQQRQYDRQFVRALTGKQIEDAATRGKIDMGGSEIGRQKVDADQAVAAALQAFEDGLYLVVIDEVEQKCLEQQVFLNPDSRITFIRLTLLTGA